ncbi:HEAT repeat domain-containing protein [Chloroflexota bacterium]
MGISDLFKPNVDRMESGKDVGGLVKALKYRDLRVRKRAAKALGRIRDSAAVQPLVESLKDNDQDVRLAALEALGIIGGTKAANAMVQSLQDDSRWIRKAAANSLDKLGLALKPSEELIYYLMAKGQWNRIPPLGDLAVEPCIRALKDDDGQVRQHAAKALGQIGDIRAAGPLVALLDDKDKDVRAAAARSLGNAGDSRAVEPLIQLLADFQEVKYRVLSQPNPGAAAAEALGKIGDGRAVGPLIQAMRKGTHLVRAVAASALGEIGDSTAAEALSQALRDDKESIRSAAAQSLGRLHREPTGIREKIRYMLAKGDWDGLVEFGEPAIKPLVEVLAFKRLDIASQGKASNALLSMGKPALKPLIAALPRSQDSSIAWLLGKLRDTMAVEPLIKALDYEDRGIRRAAAEALGEIKDPKAVDPLIKALGDKDGAVRWAAVRSLGEIGDARALEPILAWERGPHEYGESHPDNPKDYIDIAREALGKIKSKEMMARGGSAQ